jgi:hypothetical protein
MADGKSRFLMKFTGIRNLKRSKRGIYFPIGLPSLPTTSIEVDEGFQVASAILSKEIFVRSQNVFPTIG